MKRCYRLITIAIGLMLFVLENHGAHHINAQPLSSDGQALYDLFFNANCQALCFLGVESLVTTEQELIDWLVTQNLQFSVDKSGPTTIVYWQPPNHQFLQPETWVLTTIVDGVAEHTVAAIEVPIEAVIEVFGNPTKIAVDDSVNPGNDYLVYLAYPSLGIAFKTSFNYEGSTTSFSLSWPGNGFTWSELPPGEPLTQTCTTYGLPPCIAPTATATLDLPTPTDTPQPTPTDTPTPPVPVALYRINTGSTVVQTVNGVTWAADSFFTGGVLNAFSAVEIAKTDHDPIYHSEHSGATGNKSFTYNFPVTNGPHTVKLHFAEIWFTGLPGRGPAGTGRRVFDVLIENTLVLDNYDVTVAAGGALTAKIETFNVNVTDGQLTVHFPQASVDNPTIEAIEIWTGATATLTPSPTPSSAPTATT